MLLLGPAHWYYRRSIWIALILVVLITFCLSVFFCLAPSQFPSGKIIKIPAGSTLTETAQILHSQNIIRSEFFYKVAVVLIGGSKSIVMGDYAFTQPQSVLRIAYRTSNGIQDLVRIKVTIPEGLSSQEISAILAKAIPTFDVDLFKIQARPYEGYLFPDTYYFTNTTTPDAVISALRANFDHRVSSVRDGINLASTSISSRKFSDIITMASIVEKEATSSVDRRIIAGILWKRIDAKMPLQVDPPFYYFLNKSSSQLTLNDLTIDSPYNLYVHSGLTPTPIDNPGLDAIMDTMNPTPSKFWFYLSDKKGVMHYAITFDEHVANKAHYI